MFAVIVSPAGGAPLPAGGAGVRTSSNDAPPRWIVTFARSSRGTSTYAGVAQSRGSVPSANDYTPETA